MDRDDVPDEFLQLVRWMELLLLEEGQIFPEAHFVAIDLVAIQPDAMLRQFRIVELRPVSIGIVINSFTAEQERTGWDGDDWRRLSQGCDPGQMAGQFRRRLGPGRHVLGAPYDDEKRERGCEPCARVPHQVLPGGARALLISRMRLRSISAISSALTLRMRPPWASFSKSAVTLSLVIFEGSA